MYLLLVWLVQNLSRRAVPRLAITLSASLSCVVLSQASHLCNTPLDEFVRFALMIPLLQYASRLILVGVLSFLATMFARLQVRFYSLVSLCYPPLLVPRFGDKPGRHSSFRGRMCACLDTNAA